MPVLRLLGCVAVACLHALPASSQRLDGTLIVANRVPEAGSVSLFDLQTGVEVARLPVGPQFPHEIAVSPDGRYAATGEYGPGDDRGRHVVIVDVVEARIAGRVDLGPVSRPHSFAFLPGGRRLVATMEDADRVALIDLPTQAVVRTLPTGGRDGHMVRVSADGAEAYVTSRGAEGTLSIIALNENRPPVVVETGAGAEGLAVSPDGTEVWVVNRGAGTISIVNPLLGIVTATIAAPPRAGRAEISAAGRVVVPSAATVDNPSAPLTVYDWTTRRIVGGQPVSTVDAGAVSLHVVGERAFAVDRSTSSIAVYDLSDLSQLESIAAEHPYADGVGWSPLRVGALVRGAGAAR